MTCWLMHHLHKFPTDLDIPGYQILVTVLEAAGLRHRGSKSDKDTSRVTGRIFLRPRHIALMRHDSRPTPLANLATISQLKSVNIRHYTSLRTAGASLTTPPRGNIHNFPHGVFLLFRNRRRRHIALPLYLSLEICYVLPDLLSLLLSFSIALLSCSFAFRFALTWISKRSDLCLFLSGSCWGFDEWGEVYVLGTFAGFRNDTRRQVNCSDGGGGGGWCLFSLSLLPGPMIWLYGFSWDEKGGDV